MATGQDVVPIAPVPAESWRQLGLVPDGDDVEPRSGLPLRLGHQRVNGGLRSGQTPLTFVLFLPAEQAIGAEQPLNVGELPRKRVRFDRPYYLARFETTRAQLSQSPGHAAKYSGDNEEQGNLPAGGLKLIEVESFLEWLGPAYALPSEAEWERAARADGQFAFPWGNRPPTAEQCNLYRRGGPHGPVPVTGLSAGQSTGGSFDHLAAAVPRSQLLRLYRQSGGLGHLVGNLAELCQERYTPGFSESADVHGAGQFHVVRGGSYLVPRNSAGFRVTWRGNCPDAGLPDVGFRIVVRLP